MGNGTFAYFWLSTLSLLSTRDPSKELFILWQDVHFTANDVPMVTIQCGYKVNLASRQKTPHIHALPYHTHTFTHTLSPVLHHAGEVPTFLL